MRHYLPKNAAYFAAKIRKNFDTTKFCLVISLDFRIRILRFLVKILPKYSE